MNSLKLKVIEFFARIAKPNLKEVSTWQGIFKLLASAGIVSVSDGLQAHIIALCVAVAGIIDYLRKEQK